MKKTLVTVTADRTETSGYFGYRHAYFSGTLNGDKFVAASAHTCREAFMTYSLRTKMKDKLNWFLLNAGPKLSLSEFRHFIRAVERKIGIRNTIIVRPTNNPQLLCIGATSWWLKSKIRQEFLTVLLRCYAYYKGNNGTVLDKKDIPMEKVLFSYNYFNESKDATRRFLNGFTLLKKGFKCDGWYRNFANNKKNPEKALVKLDAGEEDANVPLPMQVEEQLTGASRL